MTKTHDETQAQLDAILAAMVNKGIKIPDVEVTQKAGGRYNVYLSAKFKSSVFDGNDHKFFHGDSANELLDKAEAYIAALPDAEILAVRQWHGKLADVIDEGHALALPDAVMEPLRQGSQAMTENLLAAPDAAR